MPTPIFIFTCDRLHCLKRSIASYIDTITSPFDLVIYDNASTYAPMLAYLDELAAQGIEVIRSGQRIAFADHLNHASEAIAACVARRDANHYVVTDCDIELLKSDGAILECYQFLLETYPAANVVGPMLRIDDIPTYYPLRERVLVGHTEQFWSKTPSVLGWRQKPLLCQVAPIDSTFGMYRSDKPWRRNQMGIRTYAPYWARHLDWYLDPSRLTDDQLYYVRHASAVSHWGGRWLRDEIPAAKI